MRGRGWTRDFSRPVARFRWHRDGLHRIARYLPISRPQLDVADAKGDFTPSEEVAIRRALRPIEAAAAKERQGTRTDQHSGKLPESSKGDARDKTAAYTTRKARTLEKAEAVVEVAESVDPTMRSLH